MSVATGGGTSYTGSVSGIVFNDANGNGTQDPSEQPLANWTVYIDANGNHQLDAGEKSSVTSSSGEFSIGSLSVGTYTLRQMDQAGWQPTVPADGYSVYVAGAVTQKLFGNKQAGEVLGVSTGPEVKGAATQLPRTGVPVELLYVLLAGGVIALLKVK